MRRRLITWQLSYVLEVSINVFSNKPPSIGSPPSIMPNVGCRYINQQKILHLVAVAKLWVPQECAAFTVGYASLHILHSILLEQIKGHCVQGLGVCGLQEDLGRFAGVMSLLPPAKQRCIGDDRRTDVCPPTRMHCAGDIVMVLTAHDSGQNCTLKRKGTTCCHSSGLRKA
jgi:hypothetical protein